MRLDLLLVERGLCETRAKAQALIMAGEVLVDGSVADRAAMNISAGADIVLRRGPRFVSRGGDKLEAALISFPVEVRGRICADVGASTGGFTDCLLQHGAARVYAIDVGKGQLHWKLRSDERVIAVEGTNARYLVTLAEPVTIVTIDASFISLKMLLPVARGWFPTQKGSGDLLVLIKPQFEAGRRQSARNRGIIRDQSIHRQVILDVLSFAQRQGFSVHGCIRSPILGPKGNVEFLAWLSLKRSAGIDINILVEDALKERLGV